MIASHYTCLVAAYGAALAGWLLLARVFPALWPAQDTVGLPRPWWSLGALTLGIATTIGVGWLYTRGVRIPERGDFAPVFGAINQAAIFLPIWLVLLVRREPLETVWLRWYQLPARLAAGLALAALALLVYTSLRAGAGDPLTVAARIWSYRNLDNAAQVFFEDVAIAALCVRLTAALSLGWTLILVPLCFAAAHIPAMLAGGATPGELMALGQDALLGVSIFAVLSRSRDIVWFWPIHFTIDMTQFHRIVFG